MADKNNKSEKELLKELALKRDALLKFKFGTSGSKSRNVKEGRTLRKDVARILTSLNATTK